MVSPVSSYFSIGGHSETYKFNQFPTIRGILTVSAVKVSVRMLPLGGITRVLVRCGCIACIPTILLPNVALRTFCKLIIL